METKLLRDICTGFSSLIPESTFRHWLSQYSEEYDLEKAFAGFEFKLANGTGSSIPSTSTLAQLLAESVEPFGTRNPVLLLSSGKDSVGLALAFSECGIRLDCLSLVSDAEEMSWIKSLCEKLGHKVEFISNSDVNEWLVRNRIELNPSQGVCFDQALVFFIAAAKIAGIGSDVTLIDGMGNDVYFGHIPSRNQMRAQFVGSYLSGSNVLGKYFGFYLRGPVQAHGLATVSSYIFDIKNHTEDHLRVINTLLPHGGRKIRDVIDFRAFFRGSLIDVHCYAEKTRILSRLLGCSVAFPWAESVNLSDYVFNLPIESKFDEKKLINKILLRRLLFEKLAYSRPKRGIDQLNQLDIQNISRFSIVSSVPSVLRERIIKSSQIPLSARKRALMEVAILNSLVVSLGLDVSDVISCVERT